MKYIDPDTQNAWGILQEICRWIVGYCGDLRSGRAARSKTGHNRDGYCVSPRSGLGNQPVDEQSEYHRN